MHDLLICQNSTSRQIMPLRCHNFCDIFLSFMQWRKICWYCQNNSFFYCQTIIMLVSIWLHPSYCYKLFPKLTERSHPLQLINLKIKTFDNIEVNMLLNFGDDIQDLNKHKVGWISSSFKRLHNMQFLLKRNKKIIVWLVTKELLIGAPSKSTSSVHNTSWSPVRAK